MLDLAYKYKDQLNAKYVNTIYNDKYKYYQEDCNSYTIDIEENNLYSIQFVSIDKNYNVLGYLCARLDREDNIVRSFNVINFTDKCNITFSKDLYKFILDLLLKFNFMKIEFFVIVGNPVEKMYDRFVKKHSGRIIGIKKNTVKIYGKYCDEKYYEILKNDFIKSLNKRVD